VQRSNLLANLLWVAGFCCATMTMARTAPAVIISSGNGNNDSASLIADGGPGGPNLPGFVNVGSSGANGASVTYLGNGWLLAAGHASVNSGTPVLLGGNSYTVDDSSITFLTNPDNSLADLKLVRLTTDPGLPQITSNLISSTTPNGRQIMIGNGFQRGDATFWNVDTMQDPWQWTEQSPPATPGPDDYAGFKTITNHSIRWGENEVDSTGLFQFTYTDGNGDPHFVHAYSTQFDDETYTGVAPLEHEAQLSNGDSGGAVFTLVNGQWQLGGIMVAQSVFSGQPPLGNPYFPHTVFGNDALIVDLSFYRDQIIAIVPEPSGLALAAVAAVGLLGRKRRRR
jgi:hypothetical protein